MEKEEILHICRGEKKWEEPPSSPKLLHFLALP